MTVDLESRLREALHARAAEVRPDPELWELVQARLRRARQRRLALVGVAAVAAAVALAVTVPALLGGTLIRFDSPVFDQPDGGSSQDDGSSSTVEGGGSDARPDPGTLPAEDAGAPLPPLEPCVDAPEVAAAWSRGGAVWVACVNGNQYPLTLGEAADRQPVVAPDGEAVVFERRQAGDPYPVLVLRGFADDDPDTVLGGGSLPAFAPDGRLAWVLETGEETSVLQFGRPFGEPEFEAELPHPVAQLRSLAWDPTAERLVYGVHTGEGLAVWSLEADEGRYRLVLPPEDGYAAVAFAPDGTLGGLRRAGGGVELVVLDRAVLDGGDAGRRVLLASDSLVDAGSDALFLASAGNARADMREWDPVIYWGRAAEPSWFAGDGTSVFLVEDSGTATYLQGDVDGASANPVADLSAAPQIPDEPLPDVDGEAARAQAAAAEREAEAARRNTEASAEQVREAERRAAAARRHADELLRVEREMRARMEAEQRALDVELARRRIQALALARDVDALRSLMVPDFTYSFGAAADRDAAAAHLEADPELLDALADLLDVPSGEVDADGEVLTVWPRAHALDPSEWTDGDVAVLRSLGASDEQVEQWRAGEGYTGLRAGITADGRWRFFVAGD